MLGKDLKGCQNRQSCWPWPYTICNRRDLVRQNGPKPRLGILSRIASYHVSLSRLGLVQTVPFCILMGKHRMREQATAEPESLELTVGYVSKAELRTLSLSLLRQAERKLALQGLVIAKPRGGRPCREDSNKTAVWSHFSRTRRRCFL